MRKLFIAATLLLLFVGPLSAQQRTITIVGSAEVKSNPVKEVQITLSTNNPSAVVAGAQLETLSKSLGDILARHGVDRKELKQTGANYYPNFEYNVNGPKITGYRLERGYTFDISPKMNLPIVLDALREVGAAGVVIKDENSASVTTISDQLSSALKNARERASELAREAGAQLGPILSMSEVEQSGGAPALLTEEQRERGVNAEARSSAPALRVTFELK